MPSASSDGGAKLLALDRSVASGRTMGADRGGHGDAHRKPFMMAGRGDARGCRLDHEGACAHRTKAAERAAARKKRRRPRRRVKRIPAFVEPQLARLVEAAPRRAAGWGHEVKLDGYRLQLRVVNGKAALRTRKALDWTPRFSAIAEEAADLPDCLIDGEVVALDKHRVPSFSALQAALSEGRSEDMVFFAFDLLFEKRTDLRALPLAERKARLERLLEPGARTSTSATCSISSRAATLCSHPPATWVSRASCRSGWRALCVGPRR